MLFPSHRIRLDCFVELVDGVALDFIVLLLTFTNVVLTFTLLVRSYVFETVLIERLPVHMLLRHVAYLLLDELLVLLLLQRQFPLPILLPVLLLLQSQFPLPVLLLLQRLFVQSLVPLLPQNLLFVLLQLVMVKKAIIENKLRRLSVHSRFRCALILLLFLLLLPRGPLPLLLHVHVLLFNPLLLLLLHYYLLLFSFLPILRLRPLRLHLLRQVFS